MSKKMIDLYKKWMETGKLPMDGLCNSLSNTMYYDDLDRFSPTCKDEKELIRRNLPTAYWGYELSKKWGSDRHYKFTPLRQTIVLFICAMNNEI